MRLQIFPTRLISDIQKEFNGGFPYLKLEFFSKKAFANGDYSAVNLVSNNRKIGDIQLLVTDGAIEITGEMKVKELEDQLKNKFSIAAQVFRKSGNLWLETTMTDNWTLNQQVVHGKELSVGMSNDFKPVDYDLDRDASH